VLLTCHPLFFTNNTTIIIMTKSGQSQTSELVTTRSNFIVSAFCSAFVCSCVCGFRVPPLKGFGRKEAVTRARIASCKEGSFESGYQQAFPFASTSAVRRRARVFWDVQGSGHHQCF
jgi:hypothetical protein